MENQDEKISRFAPKTFQCLRMYVMCVCVCMGVIVITRWLMSMLYAWFIYEDLPRDQSNGMHSQRTCEQCDVCWLMCMFQIGIRIPSSSGSFIAWCRLSLTVVRIHSFFPFIFTRTVLFFTLLTKVVNVPSLFLPSSRWFVIRSWTFRFSLTLCFCNFTHTTLNKSRNLLEMNEFCWRIRMETNELDSKSRQNSLIRKRIVCSVKKLNKASWK